MRRVAVILFVFYSLFNYGFVLGDEEKSQKIRLAYLQSDLHQLACWIALEKGFFKSKGLDVEVSGIFRAGPEEMSAFAAGSLDIGYVGEAPATTAVANKTANVVVLSQVNKEGSAIVVKQSSNMKHISDLIGRVVAVPGHAQVQDFLLRKALAKHGIDSKRLNIIVLKPPEMIGALKTSQIDAFIAWEPYPAKAITLDIGKILISSSDMWKNHPCCVLVVDSGFLEENPLKVKGIVRAHVEATDFIHRNADEAVMIGVKYTGMDERTVRLAMKSIKYDYIPSLEGEVEYVNFLSKLGYINIDDPRAFTDRFINDSILQEIIRK